MAKIPLPAAGSIEKLMGDLLGKKVTAAKGGPPLPKTAPVVVAVYPNDAGEVAGICVCDITLAASAGAALAMIPPGVVQESVRAGKLSENLAENLREVFNVLVRLYSIEGGSRAKLGDVFLPPAKAPAPQLNLMNVVANKVEFQVTIQGYTAGKMVIAVA